MTGDGCERIAPATVAGPAGADGRAPSGRFDLNFSAGGGVGSRRGDRAGASRGGRRGRTLVPANATGRGGDLKVVLPGVLQVFATPLPASLTLSDLGGLPVVQALQSLQTQFVTQLQAQFAQTLQALQHGVSGHSSTSAAGQSGHGLPVWALPTGWVMIAAAVLPVLIAGLWPIGAEAVRRFSLPAPAAVFTRLPEFVPPTYAPVRPSADPAAWVPQRAPPLFRSPAGEGCCLSLLPANPPRPVRSREGGARPTP